MTQMQEQPCLEQTKIHAHERKWLLCISVSMCLFALGAMHITSEKTNPVRNNSSKTSPMALYGIIAGTIVIMIAIQDWELLPVFLMSAGYCAGQVVLDIRRHPHHRLFKL